MIQLKIPNHLLIPFGREVAGETSRLLAFRRTQPISKQDPARVHRQEQEAAA
jgi:hypothetical protein